MAEEAIAAGNGGRFGHKLSYWSKLTSKRSIATVLLDGDDDDEESEFNFNQQIGSTLTVNPSLITIANASLESHAATQIPMHTPNAANSMDTESVAEQTIVQSEGNVGDVRIADSTENAAVVKTSDDATADFSTNARNLDQLNSSDPSTDVTIRNPSIRRASSPAPVPIPPRPPATAQSRPRISMLTTFDLSGVGLSSTLAIGIFLMVGYMIRHVAGPAVILSIIIATFCSYLAGN